MMKALRATYVLTAAVQAVLVGALYFGFLSMSKFPVLEFGVLCLQFATGAPYFYGEWATRRREYRALRFRHEAHAAELRRIVNAHSAADSR